MIHKTGSNLSNEEIWRLLLLEQIPTFGELDHKNTAPNHWKRNKFTWHLLQKCAVWNKALEYHTHLVQQCFWSILEQSNPSRNKHYLVWASEKRLVSTNASWYHSYWWTPSGSHRNVKNCFNSHCQKNFFSKSCSPVTKFPRNVFLFHSQNIGSCDPVSNLTAKNIVGWVGQRLCLHHDPGLYCSVWQRLPNLWYFIGADTYLCWTE